jgi:hypothetical protein
LTAQFLSSPSRIVGWHVACQFEIHQRRFASASMAVTKTAGSTRLLWWSGDRPSLRTRDYLLANRPKIPQNRLIMKCYSLLVGTIVVGLSCSSLLAQDKATLQPNSTVLSLIQGSAGKSVELHLRSGEKMGGKVAQVTDNVVHLSNLTGAEYFDAFVDVKDISAVVVRVAGR